MAKQRARKLDPSANRSAPKPAEVIEPERDPATRSSTQRTPSELAADPPRVQYHHELYTKYQDEPEQLLTVAINDLALFLGELDAVEKWAMGVSPATNAGWPDVFVYAVRAIETIRDCVRRGGASRLDAQWRDSEAEIHEPLLDLDHVPLNSYTLMTCADEANRVLDRVRAAIQGSGENALGIAREAHGTAELLGFVRDEHAWCVERKYGSRECLTTSDGGEKPPALPAGNEAIDEHDVALLAFLNRNPSLRRKVSDVLPDNGPQDRKAVAKRLRKLADRVPPLVDFPKDGRSGVVILPAGSEALKRATAPTPR
jgi:hypothetical protein